MSNRTRCVSIGTIIATNEGMYEICGCNYPNIEVVEVYFDDNDEIVYLDSFIWSKSELREAIHDYIGKYYDKIVVDDTTFIYK